MHSDANSADWYTARRLVMEDRVRWVVNSFTPYEAPSPDSIHSIYLLLIKICIKTLHMFPVWNKDFYILEFIQEIRCIRILVEIIVMNEDSVMLILHSWLQYFGFIISKI